MCFHCEASGEPPQTTQITSFATRDEAIAYGKKQEYKYLVKKQVALLHLFGLLDIDADMFVGLH